MNTTPPPRPTPRPDTAREMLRLAREKLDAADRTLSYFIATAREHELPWADISHETGLSEPTCRRRANEYVREAA